MTLGITHLHGFFGETLNCSSMLEALDDMLPRMQPLGPPFFVFVVAFIMCTAKKNPAVKICEVSVVNNLEPVSFVHHQDSPRISRLRSPLKVEERTEVEA